MWYFDIFRRALKRRGGKGKALPGQEKGFSRVRIKTMNDGHYIRL
jgi:hypothetical protein